MGVGDDLDWVRRESHLKGAEGQLLVQSPGWAGCQERCAQLSQNDRKGGLSCRWMKVGFQQIPQAPKSLGIHDLACTDMPFIHAPQSCCTDAVLCMRATQILPSLPAELQGWLNTTGLTSCKITVRALGELLPVLGMSKSAMRHDLLKGLANLSSW